MANTMKLRERLGLESEYQLKSNEFDYYFAHAISVSRRHAGFRTPNSWHARPSWTGLLSQARSESILARHQVFGEWMNRVAPAVMIGDC